LLIQDTGTEVAGEQGDYYDPLFTYKEGDEASYFILSDESEGGVADVGPSGASGEKESLMASSSKEFVAEPVASEGVPDIPATEVLRTVEVLPKIISGASPVTARVSSMELIRVSTAIEKAPGTLSMRQLGAMSVMTSSPLGNIIVICNQPLLDINYYLS